jgi:hypothetical protein
VTTSAVERRDRSVVIGIGVPLPAEVSLDQTFAMDDRKWAVINFWFYAAGSPEPTPPQFSWNLFDEQPAFE